jgi:short-subunit dehydrogenase
VAVVTGGTKGLGCAIAEIFAANGFDVCVCARTSADLDAMQRHWSATFPGRRLFTQPADLGNKADVLRFADAVRAEYPQIDVLVNNAGLFVPDSVSGEADGALERLMEINVYSAYHLTRALLPLLRPFRHGHIFNMCSIASQIAYPNGGSYTISKFALLGFSKALREELKSEGIKVTAILPGATWSDSWRGANFPTERLMQADDIAKMVWAAYQLSDSAVVEELIIRPQLGDL